MATNKERLQRIPADPDYILDFMEGLPSDDSDSDFDGYDGQIEDDDYLPITPLDNSESTSSFQNLPTSSSQDTATSSFLNLPHDTLISVH